MMDNSSAGRDEKLSSEKLHASQYVIALVLAVLVAGLWRLQVLGADTYKVLAEQNRVRKEPVQAPRGRIFDRDGRLLVDNYPSVSCYLLRELHGEQVKSLEADLPAIAEGLHLSMDQIQSTLRRYQTAPKYQPIPLKEDITEDEQAFIEAHRNELPELETLVTQRRRYPADGFAASLIGYVGEISENDLNQARYADYEPGDEVGKTGVEAAYDSVLRGVDGSRDVIVNSHGKEVGTLGEEMAKPGHDIRLSIDLDVQRAAEQAMQGKTGALVALDPHTGEVLAMVSQPTFDPNQFAVRLTRSYWNQLVNDPEHPLMNKAIQNQLAPGSTFKIIMSVAGLQENVAQSMHVMCNGGGTFYGRFFACDRRHGMVDIEHAIPWSCDTFYYSLAEKLGIDTIDKYANELGIGVKTGVDLPDEASGLMPSAEWKLKTQHQPWYAGEVISVGIGQGAIQVTPLQLARAIGGIASGGVMKRPRVIMPGQIADDTQAAIDENYPGSGDKTIQLSPENWQTITDAMADTMISGTGSQYVHLPGIDIAGKTGTAQVVNHSAGATSLGTGNARANAWFVGMVPRRNPDIVVAVLLEHGGWGAGSAPLAAQVITTFVNKQRRQHDNVRIAESPEARPETAPAATPSTPAAAPSARTSTPAVKPVSTPAGRTAKAAAVPVGE